MKRTLFLLLSSLLVCAAIAGRADASEIAGVSASAIVGVSVSAIPGAGVSASEIPGISATAIADAGVSAEEPLTAETETELETETPGPGLPAPPELSASSAVLMDAGTGVVLYSKDMYKAEYPASVTKTLTALLALENGENDLDQRISFSHYAVYSLPYNSSNIAMNEGDTLTLRDALYGLLLASANEVANAIAEHFGGSIEGFADMMNSRAAELGAVNTHFVNPSGLYEPEHQTCAYDMALFMREAVKHSFFVQAISTVSYQIPPTESEPLGHPLYNQNKMITPGGYYREDVVGGKTGYTDEAQHTLVTYAERDGIGLIAAVMHEPNKAHYADTAALLDYGFEGFHEAKLLDKTEYAGSVSVIQPYVDGEGRSVKLSVRAEADVRGLFPLGVSAGSVTLKPEIRPGLEAPVEDGAEVGKLTVLYKGAEIASVGLLAVGGVPLEQAPPDEIPAVLDASVDAESGGVADANGGEAGGGAGSLFLSVLMWALAAAAAVILGFIIAAVFMRRARRRRRKTYALRYAPGMGARPRRPRASEWSARRYR